ncbi:MAG: BamA/TamA family outer membrane protein [Elusimicrobiota bacterium]
MIRFAPRLVLAACLVSTARGMDTDGTPQLVPRREFPTSVQQAPQEDSTPAVVRWMIRPLRRGLFIRLPIMDTDPNRGITAGIMPIWVIQGETDERIKAIHAPSLTYNDNFKFIPTYRYYFYPQEDASLVVIGSYSEHERELGGEYIDQGVAGSEYNILLRAQYNVDAGQRFYGFGPDSAKTAEANYKEDLIQYRWGIGVPLVSGSKLRVNLAQHYQSGRILDGPLAGLPLFRNAFPAQFAPRRAQINENRLSLDYDTRDHGVTTERGTLFQTYAEGSLRGFLSSYDYERYGFDYRWFKPWGKDKVFALQMKFDQLLGQTPPFWVLSRLGGKYSLRAYGNGRYIDRGMAAANIEQRFKLFEQKLGGVTTEFQLAPFAGAGTVFDTPERAAARYVRTVVGTGVRAVAKPQVVGSIDFGVGREGLAVFMDINYSF